MTLQVLSIISDCAIIDRFEDIQHNYIERKNKDFDKFNHDIKDKCVIKVTTSGVCTVNSQLIKPEIKVFNSFRGKY